MNIRVEVDAREQTRKIGMAVIEFQENILKRVSKLKRNPTPDNFKAFRKFFKDEVFQLYCKLDEPFGRAVGNENAREYFLDAFNDL